MTTPTHRCTTREEAAEINRRLRAAGLKSCAEDCYDQVGRIWRNHKCRDIVGGIIDKVLESTEGI